MMKATGRYFDFSESTDIDMVRLAQQGDRAALEELILRHQQWIFNIALRMVGSADDAEDVTQEILIKMITKLSTFQGKSKFRTWLYRITANHVINMKKRPREFVFSSFAQHAGLLDNAPDLEPPDTQSVPVNVQLLIEETRVSCMMGMLLCLDREQRLVFILGAILSVPSEVGADVLEISPQNFRQKLSRIRKQLNNFMEEKCGLMRKENPCSCARKTKAALLAGYVDPHHLQFHQEHVQQVKSVVTEYLPKAGDVLELRSQVLFQKHPFLKSPGYAHMIDKMLEQEAFQTFLNFN
jgi:RNA polymerase sigma factor (sigma-70 family)